MIALTIAPFLDSPAFGGIFNFIQEFQGFLSPGALCVFLFGFFVPKCPRIFGWLGIVINALLYGILKVWQPEMAFLNRMAVCFITVVVIGFIFTAVNAARGGQPIVLPDRGVVALQSSSRAKIFRMARGCRDGRPVHYLLVIQGRPPVPYFQSSRFRPGGFFTSGTDHAAGAAEYSGGGKPADWRFRTETAPCSLIK